MMALSRIGAIQPILKERKCGGWLAHTPSEATYCIGVTAATEQQAKEDFLVAVKRWDQIISETIPASRG